MLGQDCPSKPPWPGPAVLPGSAFHWLGISPAQSHAGFLMRHRPLSPLHNLSHTETQIHTGLLENLCVRTLYSQP